MKKKLLGVFVLAAAFVAFGEPLVVDKGSTVSLQEETKTEKKYDSVTVHGTLNVLTNVLLRSYNGMVLGSTAGDNAIVNISGPRDTTGVGFTNATSGVISIGAETDGGAAQIRVAGDQEFNPPTASQFSEFYSFKKYLFAYSVQSTTILAGTAANGQDAEGNPTIDWLKLDAGGVAASRGINNNSTAYPARILFNGGAIYNNNQWSITYFQGLKTNILESVDGNPIIIANTYANYTFNSSGTVVETRGDGDVIFVSTADATQGSVTMNRGVVWNHAGDVCVDQNTRLFLAAADLLPHNPNGGILRIGSTPGGTTQMVDVKGKSSDVNGIVAGNGYVTNSSATRATLTLGRERAEAILSGRILGGIDLVKEGEGPLVVSNLTAESLNVTAGSIRLLGNNSIRSLTLAEDVKILMTSVKTDYSQAYVPNLGAEVIVDGGHVLTARIDDEFNAPLTVLADTTLRLVPSPCANKYWRFTFKACWKEGKDIQLTRALLVNAAGGLLYNNARAFTRDADGTAATSLAANHCAITQGFTYRSDGLGEYYDPNSMH